MQREISEIELDTICANKAIICFENRLFLSSINIVQVFTSIGIANFYIVNSSISFLLYLKDIDIINIYLNNIIHQLIDQNGKSIPMFRK